MKALRIRWIVLLLLLSTSNTQVAIINRSYLGIMEGETLVYQVTQHEKDVNQPSISSSRLLLFKNLVELDSLLRFEVADIRNNSLTIQTLLSVEHKNGSESIVGFGTESLKQIGSLAVYPDWDWLSINEVKRLAELNFTHPDGIFSLSFTDISSQLDESTFKFSSTQIWNRTQLGAVIRLETITESYEYDAVSGILQKRYQTTDYEILDDPHPYQYKLSYELVQHIAKPLTSSDLINTSGSEATGSELIAPIVISLLGFLWVARVNRKGKIDETIH